MKKFSPFLTASINRKGVLDVDAVKGCEMGMKAYPNGGCYGVCYAASLARAFGYDYSTSVSRKYFNHIRTKIVKTVDEHNASWFRIGTMGDPSHDWQLTTYICQWLGKYKVPVVVTKHWIIATDKTLDDMAASGVILHTSVSALDRACELEHRLKQHDRAKQKGINAMLRIVSANFGNTELGVKWKEIQDNLFLYDRAIDNPLRIHKTDWRVSCGHIVVIRIKDLNVKRDCSVAKNTAYLGECGNCPDQCGSTEISGERKRAWQPLLFKM